MRLTTYLIPGALLIAALAGCDHVLSTTPYASVPANQEIVDAATAEAALNGAYDAMQSSGVYGLDMELVGDMPADNSTWVGTYQFLGDLEANTISADNPELTEMWEALYQQIDRDNVILQRVPQVTSIPKETADEIMGEAYFLRALNYHNLVKFWGGVPMPLTPVASATDAAKYTRASVDAMYTQILSDLDQAGKLISNTSDTRHATTLAVSAIRARVLFYRASLPGNASASADYAAALASADTVLAAYGDTLTVPYADLFTANGTSTPEDIFRVSFTAAEYNNLGYYWLYDGRFEAAPTASIRALFDSLKTPADRTAGSVDARRSWSINFRPGSSSRYQVTKWPTTIGAEHPHVIRLAELVLLKAEVLARQNNLAGAVAEYNKVRVRAGLLPHVLGVDVTTQADVLAAIERERRGELAFEGDRWPDLVRLGQAIAVKQLAKPGYVLFPIPLREINTTPGMQQNPGY